MNRRAFREQAVIEIERSRRFGRIFTIAYIDLDNFKLVNDEFGHEAGDGLLKDLVAAIRRNTRASDVLCRLGGDEFAVLLPETGGEAALVAFSRVRDAYLARMTELDYPVTMSVGLITYKDMPEGFDAMLNAADNLMYEAKKSGKNCIKHTNA
jgi:diguanylate cyclase (GGDEF)-like protein